jgi:acyl transferase domain-containing protein/acyl carrier protein/SAM-dependent methyltransferase
MRRVLQYILHEVKEGRLSKPSAVELTKEIHTQGKLDQPSVLHPLLHRNTSDLSAQRFSTRLSGEEAYLHGVNGARVLPEVAHLEMARAAAAAGEDTQDRVRLEQVEWLRPVVVGPDGLDLHLELFAEEDGKTGYEIYSGAAGAEGEARLIHSHGWFAIEAIEEDIIEPEIPAEKTFDTLQTGNVQLTPVWEPVAVGEPAVSWPSPADRVVIIGGTSARLAALHEYYPHAQQLNILPETTPNVIGEQLRALGNIDHIVWLAPEEPLASLTADALIEGQQHGVMQCFHLIKALLALGYGSRTLGWTVITTQVQAIHPDETVNPTHASIHGLIGSMAKEYAKWKIRLVDLEADREPHTAEIFSLPPDRRAHAWISRNGVWHQHQLIRTQSAPPSQRSLFRNGGVYVIIGGAGDVGQIFSEYLVRAYRAQIVWIGRREKDAAIQARLDHLATLGCAGHYVSADAADRDALQRACEEVKQLYGQIHGVVHAAMVFSSHSLEEIDEKQFKAALSAKVDVSVRIAQVFEHEPLDFVLFFSSLISFIKNPKQSHYASGCAFKDAFAGQLAQKWLPPVKTMNWGYWGQSFSPELAEQMRQTGLGFVDPVIAMRSLESLLVGPLNQLGLISTTKPIPVEGVSLDEWISIHSEGDGVVRHMRTETMARRTTSDATEGREGPASHFDLHAPSTDREGELLEKIRTVLVQEVSLGFKLKVEDITLDRELSEYGFDSISFTALAHQLNQRYGLELMPTMFFEHPTLGEVARYLVEHHRAVFAARFAPAAEPAAAPSITPNAKDWNGSVQARPRRMRRGRQFAAPKLVTSERAEPATADAVAVIGMSGRFPMAEDVAGLWRNLVEGRDCIVEIPNERWDWRAVDGDPLKQANKTNVKWGGFIDGIDEFDPLFFGISPREAELMDPQQRLMMSYIWKAIEDAGYSAASLAGSRTAILVGAANSGYGRLIAGAHAALDSYGVTGLLPSVGPNRMSYFLDLHGPSEPIETACSSSLVAVHRAIQALASDSCEMAIAGGVNTLLTPHGHISLSRAGMLSVDGRCKTFSRYANGYVRGEGVGMLVLKKLQAAERDGDHIYGVIRGSAENHGGRAQSLTAPNPKAQAELLKAAYSRAGIDPRTVGYIEAHGTGTELGDPIEINGLKSAFRDLTEASGDAAAGSAYCGLGTVKSNIGHLEFAAGVAGMIKVLLQLQHKTLVKSLHCEELNPYIQLEDSPFYIVREKQDWQPLQDAQGRDLPRRAGISSFGVGGSNAHVVVEEYVPRADAAPPSVVSGSRPALVVLSAKNAERLRERAEQLVDAIEQRPLGDADLADVAYTLQVGREAMECRLGCVVEDLPQLCTRLRAWLDGDKSVEDLYQGQVRQHKEALGLFTGDELEETISKWIERGKLNKLLDLWVKGLSFDWLRLYGDAKPRRISLPTYPFARECYWVEASAEAAITASAGESESEQEEAAAEASARSAAAAEAFELLTFEEVWEAQVLPAPSGRKMQRVVCLLSDAQSRKRVVELIHELDPRSEVIFVAQDAAESVAEPDGSQDRSAAAYRVRRGDAASYRDAFSRIGAAHGEADAVLYLWGLEEAGCAQDPVVPMHLLQGLASSGLKCGRLLLAGAYGDELSRSHLESWIGFERSLDLVWPQTRVAVSGQEADLAVEQWLPRLWGELASERFESAFYRDGLRWVCRVRPRALESVESPLRMGGTYLISGGCGGLGLLVAEHLARKWAANLILLGRSALDDGKRQAIARLEALGGAVEYAQADVCDSSALEQALRAGELRFGALHGVIHAAGIVGSGSVFEKDVERFNAVLAPKITGTLVLDEVLGDRALDFVCYFSSSSAQLGDFGGCDYAIGNRFLMAHAHYRNQLQARGERQGKAVVINWGLWQDGGMGVGGSEQTRMYLKSSGQRALGSAEGVEMFERLLGQSAAQHLVLAGQAGRVHRFLGLGEGQGQSQASSAAKRSSGGVGRYQGNRADLKGLSVAQCVSFELTGHVSALVKLPRERLDAEENLADFGLDSIGLAELARRLTQHFSVEISPSVFFSHPTLAQLTGYFANTHAAAVEALYRDQEAAGPTSVVVVERGRIEAPPLQPFEHPGPQLAAASAAAPNTGMPEPIAIIGMSGRFPKARTVEEMWRILEAGEDAVEEIPSDRFDWRKFYGDPQREPGKTDCKWGGFVPGVGEFDPLFFEISPREAELMDPRQRLLLMESWKALEDAGYGATQLGDGKVGMFVGVEHGDYELLTRGGGITANHDGILASRLGYFLNMRGPAMAINTACSSALVALHQACLSLRNGECDAALAAGVNLILTPMMHIGTSQAGMLSKDGKCRPFDRGANGMVPGEAVAVVVLKRLSQAEADGDPIHAVIRGSGINYDGKTNGITAPSGASQSSLLQDVYERHGVNAEEIDYIVTHGTGTRLGDPVEVNALNDAFKHHTQRQGFCALTSSKSNFGHTLAASGLVSLIGLVQSLRHGIIPASLHCAEDSDYIDWQASAFYVNKTNKPWPEKTGGRRLGAVSAFGMSGTNAHVVVESYRPTQQDDAALQAPCYLLALSARTEAALAARIEQLIAVLEQRAEDLPAMSHTLLCGRQHFQHRCAFVAEDREAALYGLRQAIGRERTPNLFQGTVARHFSGQKTLLLYGNELLQRCDGLRNDPAQYQETLCALADLYCQGYALDWQNLHASATPRRIPLPTYPFATERYWVEASARPAVAVNGFGGAVLHPPLHRNTSDLSAQRFSTRLSGEESYLRGVNGARVLSEVAHLEMARAAVAAAAGEDAQDEMRLEQVEWLQPVIVGPDGLDLHVELFPEDGGKTGYEIYSGTAEGEDARLIHSHGWFCTEAIQPEEAAESEPPTEELLTYPQVIPSTSAELHVHHKELAGGEPPKARADAQEIDELAGKLLWTQLIAAGFPASGKANLTAIKAGLGLHSSYDRWLEASLRILVERGTIAADGETWSALEAIRPEAEASWEEWEAHKDAWLTDPVVAPRIGLVETTLRALPGILTGGTRATDVIFPNGSLALVEGVYKNNPVADYFNDALAGMVAGFVEERIKQDPSARIRILEVGAGTGGTSAPVLARLKSYTPHIEEYCYTDISQAFLLHAQAVFGPDHPYLSYGIFNVEKPISGQTIDADSYDIVIATNVLHATRDIHCTLRNVKAALRTNGLLLLNEISRATMFTHLTFGLLEGWWLFEDGKLRIPGCPGLFPETWREVLEQEGFRSILFPVADVHAHGQQIVVAESDGVVRQVRVAPKTRRKTSGLPATEERKSSPDHSVLRTGSMDEEGGLLKKVQASLVQEVSKLIKMKVEALDIDSELSEYGFDSISFTALAHQLNQRYGLELMPTMFFEHPTLGEVARHLVGHYRAVFAARFAPAAEPAAVQARAAEAEQIVQARPRRLRRGRQFAVPKLVTSERAEPATADAVAVIGMSGRFPMAEDVAGLWRNLVEGRDCIVEIPNERWDWHAVDGDPFKEANKTNVKWGGFIDGIGEFDPLFFGISPREAELMDPSQRLMMTYIWKAIEDAGYSAASLAGSRTAILMGAGNSGYGRLIARAGTGIDSYSVIGLMPSVGPNRVSYFLDLHGPSEPIETACSSSLVAVHRAMQALASDSCEMAIAGGVNTMLMPDGHIGLSRAGMLSVDGRCKAFSKHANGYARGEGVGMLVLKTLKAAERDGDHIYGVICGSAENHGGRAQSLTAPNPKAQAELLKAAYSRAGIDPRTVGYIEAHGTGTVLGDPIEINGLKSAFRDLTQASGNGAAGSAYCGLGTVKSNIGHLELAAGVAGLIKVLLQLQHKTLVKSLHCEELNPYIQLEDSPFYIVREKQDWRPIQDAEGRDLPRRAGISSFGAGGSNAHVVIEEYVARTNAERPLMVVGGSRPALVVLSAKNAEQLKQRAGQLVEAIEQRPLGDDDLMDMAYTLQVGRDAMECRLAVMAGSMVELKSRLQSYFSGERAIEGFYQGETKREKETLAVLADEDMARTIEAWVEKGKYGKLLELWVRGLSFDWQRLYGEAKPRRISLPTYPFARERHWVETRAEAAAAGLNGSGGAMLHPLLHRNMSDSSVQRFSTRLNGDESCLRAENGSRVLPDVAHLEIARAAMATAAGKDTQDGVGLEQVEWLRPVAVGADGLDLHVELFAGEDKKVGYEIYSGVAGSEDEARVIHSQGWAVVEPTGEPVEVSADASAAGTILVKRAWQPRAVQVDAAPVHGQHWVMLCGGQEWAQNVEAEVKSALPQVRCIVVTDQGAEGIARRYEAGVLQVLDVLQRIVQGRPKDEILIQAVVPVAGEGAVFTALAGLLKTARLEYPKLKGQVIGFEAQESAAQIVRWLDDNTHAPDEREVRYLGGERQVSSWRELMPAPLAQMPWRDSGVYLISGGTGGLGFIFAEEIARRVKDAVVVLTGRSELNGNKRARLAALEGSGNRIEYRRVDVTDGAAVTSLISSLRETYGGVSGIIHAAGVIRDSFLLKKTVGEAGSVLRPKVLGVVNLDEATADLTLEFMVLFASVSGSFGNVGQADYAAANAFLDSYAAHRNELVSYGERWGRTVSIAWPLWRDGGMRVDAAVTRQLREAGQQPLEAAGGLQAFYQALAADDAEIAVLSGEPQRLRKHLFETCAPQPVAEPGASLDPHRLAEKTLLRLKALLADITKLRPEQIEPREQLESYGIDSMMIMQLNHELAGVFGELSKTLFFEYPTLSAVTEYLVAEHEAACARWAGLDAQLPASARMPASASKPPDRGRPVPIALAKRKVMRRGNGFAGRERDPIAIIGISGRYPGAQNLEEYWENLRSGKDCVGELPPDRWPLEGFYDPHPDASRGKSYSKWGGFLSGFADFDPLFFNISPREAANTDPQERLFVQSCWEALEDGGYTKEQLKVAHQGRVGVFAGITKTGFALHGPELWRQGERAYPHTSFGSVANRVSYFLNLRGPSMPIDTMCSASLTAIHEACEHLYRDECELALAGGVNLYLHPRTYVELCALRMLSLDGRCKSFGKGGDGFVPGEGVGVVLLKRLSKALEAEDQIHAVIRGTSINHGGKTNGYTVPNPVAQKELVRAALEKAGVSARAVSYIEAHGTGTELGDPIEITGLSQAFAQDTAEKQFCAIGSVKSNIGHLEAAAGIAGVTKVVLQMKHRQLAPSLHAEELNPHIDFANSPFVVQRKLAAWPRPVVETDGVRREHLRVAGISSFGAGGSNAHVVIEEYVAPTGAARSSVAVSSSRPALVVLSAKNAERLKEQAAQLVAAIERRSLGDDDLADVAYTLQVGREAMECRLGVIAGSMAELRSKLQDYLAGEREIEDLYRGETKREKETLAVFADEDMARTMAATIEAWVQRGKYGRLLEQWVKGLPFDWQGLYGEARPRRISLPTYPFAKQRYWFEAVAGADRVTTPAEIVQGTSDGLAKEILPLVTDASTLAPNMDLEAEVRASLHQWTCELLRIPGQDLDAESELSQYGLDSISSVQLVNRINRTYGIELRPTSLFEHPTLAGFARYLVEDHGDALAAGHHRSGGVPARAEFREPTPAIGQSSLSEIVTSSRSRRNAVAVQLQGSLVSEVAKHPQKSSFNGAPFAFGPRQRPQTPPLSYMQENMLLMHQRTNVGSAYHLPMGFRLVGSLDTAALQASFTEVARRHESLRTRFSSADDGAVQVIEPSVAVELPIVDLQHLNEDERPDEARRLSAEWLRRPFDLEVAPLFRVGVIRLRPTEHMLVIVAHHLVTDGWSMELLIREVSALYSAFSRGLPSPLQNVPVQYADYAIWQRQQVQERILDRELGYWTDRLVDAPVLELPTDRPRPSAPSYRGSTVLFSFPERDVAALRGLAQREGVSLFMVLFAAFNTVLFRWTGQEDIVVGTPIAGRRLLEFENSIGFFTNWLALRNDLSGKPTFRELLQRVKDTSLSAFAHQDLPLVKIEAEIKSMRDLSRHPLFRVLVGLQRVSPGAAFTGLEASPVHIENNTSRRDQCFFLYETPDGLFGIFEYATDLFDASTIERMIGEFRAVLYQMLADPDARIASPVASGTYRPDAAQ